MVFLGTHNRQLRGSALQLPLRFADEFKQDVLGGGGAFTVRNPNPGALAVVPNYMASEWFRGLQAWAKARALHTDDMDLSSALSTECESFSLRETASIIPWFEMRKPDRATRLQRQLDCVAAD